MSAGRPAPRAANRPRRGTSPDRIAVVGGGLQGCAVALELAARGARVELFERAPVLYAGASRNNEGKVHLGFVYAADPTLRTARLMAAGAAAFLPALRRWLGSSADQLPISTPFTYVVHRDSLRCAEDLARTYSQIAELVAGRVGDYFGTDAPSQTRWLETGELEQYGPHVAAAFATSEVSVHPDRLADAVVAAVQGHPGIAVQTRATVVRADRVTALLQVEDVDGRRTAGPFDAVVNCAWDGRLTLDARAGVHPAAPWTWRMKYFARVALEPGAKRPPSTTIVLGPFGDVVDLGGGDMYLSWYPVGRRGWSTDPAPPAWPARVEGQEARRLMAGMGDGLSGVLPRVGDLLREPPGATAVRGGVIYALGETDVDDSASGLHRRSAVGPASIGRYHTVDTGKLTLAPLFALRVADRVTGSSRAAA